MTNGQVYLDTKQQADADIMNNLETYDLKDTGFFVKVSRLYVFNTYIVYCL